MNTKLSAFRALLNKNETDAAIITDEMNIGYLCGYYYTDGYLYIDSESAYIITDSRYDAEAKVHASTEFSVIVPKNRNEFLKELIGNHSVKTLGFENRSMTVAQYNGFERELNVDFVPLGLMLTEMRAVKTPDEIAKIKRAQEITDLAFSHILSIMHPTMTETEVALELSYYMQKNGAGGASFNIVAVSGEASAYPHGMCRPIPLSAGFLTMDFGCMYDHYLSDMTRTVVVGKATSEMKHLYQTVLTAQERALEVIREGADCKAVDSVAREYIDGNGYRGAFGHSLGHGVGLYVHESPNLSPNTLGKTLVAGNVVTVEPGIYLPGKYGCRIEDMGAVTKEGFDNFTHSTKELIELF
ncbi:MAG: aminopeptidase P family protein [Ruminococcaceae bacterium]|nr:aminopeptidase P family protein [Oscillospiraceae bacterium]